MATDKHLQRFQQQFGDRCPASAVVATVVQPPLAATVQVAASDATSGNKRNNSQSSIAIQVASTSNEQLQESHHHQDSPLNNIVNQISDNYNQSTPTQSTARTPSATATATTTTTTNALHNCHHQAATRTLLFHHHHRLIHQKTTKSTTADSLQTTTDNSINSSISSSGSGNSSSSSGSSDEIDRGIIQSPTPPPNYHEIPGIVPAYQGRSSGPPPSYDDVVNPNAPPPTYQSLFGQVREARKTSNGLVDLLRQLFLILIGTLGCTMIIGFLLLIPITMILVGIVYVNECKAENIPTFLVIGGIVWIMKNILNCYNQFKKDSSTNNRPPARRSTISSRALTSSNPASNNQITGGGDSPASVLIVGHQQTTSDINNNQIINNPTETTTTTTSSSSSSSSSTTTTTTTTTIRTRREQEQSANRIRSPSLIGITSFKCESMLNYFLIVWFFAGCIVVYRIYEPDYDNPMSQSYCHRTVYLYAFWLITSAFIIMAIVLSCLCCLMASSLMNCNHGR